MASETRIPVLVVSGFLGSGKTTLVKRLLADAQARGSRMAVVSNEFGAVGIDRALLDPSQGRYVELEGGCVCCELSDELVEQLEEIRRDVAPDRIVVETSGVALPYDTQLSLWRPPVSDWVGDDMAVVVVNAEQLAEGRDLGDTFEFQVTAADLLVLNQIDRVAPAALDGLEERLRALEPDVPIVRAEHARVDPRLLEPPPVDEADRDSRGRRPAPMQSGVDGHGHAHAHEQFESTTWTIEADCDEGELVRRLRAAGAIRAKGFIATKQGLRLVQGVGRRIEFEPAEPIAAELVGRVVLVRRAGSPVEPG